MVNRGTLYILLSLLYLGLVCLGIRFSQAVSVLVVTNEKKIHNAMSNCDWSVAERHSVIFYCLEW